MCGIAGLTQPTAQQMLNHLGQLQSVHPVEPLGFGKRQDRIDQSAQVGASSDRANPNRGQQGFTVRNRTRDLTTCRICGHTTGSREERTRHTVQAHGAGGTAYLCPFCNKHFLSYSGCVSHVQRSHPAWGRMECRRCKNVLQVTVKRSQGGAMQRWAHECETCQRRQVPTVEQVPDGVNG